LRAAAVEQVMTHSDRLARPLFAFAALLLAVAVPAPAPAHEYWLAPSRYAAPANTPVELSAIAGTGFRGDRKPFAPQHTVRLAVIVAKPLDLTRVAKPGDVTWARFAPADDRGALFAYQSDFTPITLPAADFDRYLGLEGLDGPLAARRRAADGSTGRERFRRCAKAWLAGHDAARATAAVGLPLEIVPLAAPGTDAMLRVRVLWQGRPLAGALLKAWRAPLAAARTPTDAEDRDSVAVAWQARTDARGEVNARVATAGEWLLSVVHMEPSAARAEADWESTWASLTFARMP
jgi:uncharacterized GH25 family protein